MSQIQDRSDISNIDDPKEFMRHASILLGAIVDTVNGGLEFGKNVSAQVVDVVFPLANVELDIPHNLGRPISNYILTSSNIAAVIYSGSKAPTNGVITLKANVPITAKILLF